MKKDRSELWGWLVPEKSVLSCYNRKEHSCDGRCQGATDCPMAWCYATKKEMIAYIKELKRERKQWKIIKRRLRQTKYYAKFAKFFS